MNRNIFILSVMAFFIFTAIAFSAITQTKTDKSKDSCGCSIDVPKSVKTANNATKPWWYKRDRGAGAATGSDIKINGPSVVSGKVPGIKVGQYAPNITLTKLKDHPDFSTRVKNSSDRRKKVALANFVGKKPVVLIFGSYTCPPFRNQMRQVNALYKKYKDQAMFLFVYIREAHPAPDGQSAKNAGRKALGSTVFTQPKTFAQRCTLANAACDYWETPIPTLVDTMNSPASAVYQGWPNRLFIIDKSGRITYCGPVGPKGTRADEAEQALKILLNQADTPKFTPVADAMIFDGQPKLIVVNGYSTSFAWPQILQRKLDRYFGKRIVEVKAATKGSTPIAKWMNVKTGQPLEPWEERLQPLLKNRRPTIVLAQQSLQWAFGGRSKGINNSKDQAGIKHGADVLQNYAELMLKHGADEVFIATHIYKKPMEPQIGNERLALTELIKRQTKHIHAGPDVWKPTKQYYGQAFAKDRVHPNTFGAEIIAQYWFETILKKDGIEVPAWSRHEMGNAANSPSKQDDRRAKFRSRMLKRYDKDGDGKLNKEERATFQRAREARRKNRQK